MLGALQWIGDAVFSLLKIACIWVIIKVIVKCGKTTFKELLDTIVLRLRVTCAKSRLKDVEYLKQGTDGEKPADDQQGQKVEARIL